MSTTPRRFTQLDVFTATPGYGNALAVVHDAQGLTDTDMARFARWTNLSETTFLLPPTHPHADYHVRIFTPGGELPFAGHPTLGSCHAWLAAGGQPQHEDHVVQECGIGLVPVRRGLERLAFAAPQRLRSGPLEPELRKQIAKALRITQRDIKAHQWCDNGPGWAAVMLADAAKVLALQPDWAALGELKLGVVGRQAEGADSLFEVRSFISGVDQREDPVTGSLNASLAQWLIGAGLAPKRYVAAQGTALGRAGRVFVEAVDDQIWVGGHIAECIQGEARL